MFPVASNDPYTSGLVCRLHRSGIAGEVSVSTINGDQPLTKSTKDVLSNAEMAAIDAYWRAANYLSIGQIYLYDNPLLKKPLAKEHIKPRLLGHWGTTPGLNFIYAH